MRKSLRLLNTRLLVLVLTALCGVFPARGEDTVPRILGALDVDKVPAAFPVGFCLLTAGQRQYVAYYDRDHHMTIASRALTSSNWTRKTLDSTVGWDSHNYVTMAVDADGYLHVSGNMHNVPLIYFRSRKPQDITTLEPVPNMVGAEESHCTYPQLSKTPRAICCFSIVMAPAATADASSTVTMRQRAPGIDCSTDPCSMGAAE